MSSGPTSMVHRSGDTLIVRSVFDTIEKSDFEAENGKQGVPLPECKVKRNYSCNNCDFFTQNPREYLYHLRDTHGAKVKIYECPHCLYASKHFQKLLRHSKMVHSGAAKSPKPEPAAVVDDEAQETDDSGEENGGEESETAEEAAAAPPSAIFKCSLCQFVGKARAQLNRHERDEHIKTKFFRCGKCSYATHMKARFTKHVKYHSMPMIKCDMCDFRTPYKWNLDRHCKNHNGRGAFKCSACNFTADIKQSLTVHEMNHHVPPVGQAAGLGVGRRRNKVGASDATAAEEAAIQKNAHQRAPYEQVSGASTRATTSLLANNSNDLHEIVKKSPKFGTNSNSDFIHPDDIIHHANGNVYIKTKCKYCNYKSAWNSEMIKHEKNAHGINNNAPATSSQQNEQSAKNPHTKKTVRPIPNLIPIPSQKKCEPTMSEEDMYDICAKSKNSALKDLASLFDSADVFAQPQQQTKQMPELAPRFQQKNAGFFDKLKEKLMRANNLECAKCGHESKCLTEQVQHEKACGSKGGGGKTARPSSFISASRCQYCRQRCKSSHDYFNHLQTCAEALKADAESESELKIDEQSESDDDIDADNENNNDAKPHPMVNRIFVWNNIEAPMETDEVKFDDQVSLDFSVRTQSPSISESSYPQQPDLAAHQYASTPPPQVRTPAAVQASPSGASDKIPTHGNDISVAQHKRVFKCPHCTFWASTASRFHVHIVGHLNKKPFECSLCSYRSNWRWDITKHIKLKSVRDPQHESAKVLMTDETGRRNYTKYNKFLTEINVVGNQGLETSGGSGTRGSRNASPSSGAKGGEGKALRPPPALKAADFKGEKGRRRDAENRRTLFKCKKCNFRDASREVLLAHVKAHYHAPIMMGVGGGSNDLVMRGDVDGEKSPIDDLNDDELMLDDDLKDEASVTLSSTSNNGALTAKGNQAPFRCGHCNQVSNWKHVIQRHCRLKHSGDVRVVSNKNGQEKIEIEEQTDEPDHIDVPQTGIFKCDQCPFSSNENQIFDAHLTKHSSSNSDLLIKCHYCDFHGDKGEIRQHLPLHGIADPDDFLAKISHDDAHHLTKRFRCLICPYVTNSKSQYTYHKQFHKPRDGQYNCTHCSYNVSKRHLLHQHLKVHGINVTPQKQNGDIIDFDDIADEIEEITAPASRLDPNAIFPDIPLVWVSKSGKFSKMFKCRYCPHVNLRKVNIQEHEKMHSIREKSKSNDVEHRCSECNYVCNNAGVLSSHSKVHQGVYGMVHCLVDQVKSDEEQISELSKMLTPKFDAIVDEFRGEIDAFDGGDDNKLLFYCQECPARFFRETEAFIHAKLHDVRLFYKCDFCSYSAREKPHIFAHVEVHSSEYQERTANFRKLFRASTQAPELVSRAQADGVVVWQAVKPSTSAASVPISGTELFAQKSEAQAQLLLKEEAELMHGNPNFTYPTYLKNGRMKEKRYKCHKCPSAFEKREQYKTHLGLHGSNQRYKCEHCDYSVKYSANYVQHLKKHKVEEAAVQEEEVEEKTSIGDQQALNLLQQRLLVNTSPSSVSNSPGSEEKKLFNCTLCPYVNDRRDSVENHQKRHLSVSGIRSNFTCEHCDYTVPQVHFLKKHTKLHFVANKGQIDGYMACEGLRLSKQSDGEVIYEEKTNRNSEEKHVTDQGFNNNQGEKKVIDLETGDEVVASNGEISEKMDES